MADSQWLEIKDLRGGRNGFDAPSELNNNEVCDAVNVEWGPTRFGRKRGGASTMNMTGSTMTGVISSLGRFVPSSDDGEAELFASDDAVTPNVNRLDGSGVWSAPTLKDAPTGEGWDFSYASLDGLFFIAYESAVNRLHCYDPSTGTVRRAGMAPPAAPSVTDTGAGSYTATLRYYRARFLRQVAGVTILHSDPGTGTAFTPSGTGTAARVNRPTDDDGIATHWVVEVSLDNATFYTLSTLTVATATYDDSASTASYTSLSVATSVGLYAVQKPYKFIASDDGRLLGFGSYNPDDPQARVEFSGIVGGGTLGAAEISPAGNNYITLNEKGSGAPTGLIGPIEGVFFAFKYNEFWRLTPSGNPALPYQKFCISKTVGAVGPEAIVLAEDELGNPCIYFMSSRGVYRYGTNGLQYIGNGIEDMVFGPTTVMNTSVSKIICHAEYHADLRQVWFWITVGADDDPTHKLVFNIGRYDAVPAIPSGWARHDGPSCQARCSVMFSKVIGSPMSKQLVPYVGYTGANNTILRADESLTDGGTAFRGYIVSRAMQPWGQVQTNGEVMRTYVRAKAAANVSLILSIVGDYGEDNKTVTSTINLTPLNSETRVTRQFEDSGLSDLNTVQFIWGDEAATEATWHIDMVLVEASSQEVQ